MTLRFSQILISRGVFDQVTLGDLRFWLRPMWCVFLVSLSSCTTSLPSKLCSESAVNCVIPLNLLLQPPFPLSPFPYSQVLFDALKHPFLSKVIKICNVFFRRYHRFRASNCPGPADLLPRCRQLLSSSPFSPPPMPPLFPLFLSFSAFSVGLIWTVPPRPPFLSHFD